MQNENKRKRGRPAGSTGSYTVKRCLGEIINLMGGDMDAEIVVSRKWFCQKFPNLLNKKNNTIQSSDKQEEKIEFTIN